MSPEGAFLLAAFAALCAFLRLASRDKFTP
jgi:hypothetical protein